jgi:hypothetical protein
MSEFSPVATVGEFQTLDESDVLLGYLEGFEGSPLPCSSASRSFCHGWRNGMVDGGFAEVDEAQMKLAAAFRNERPVSIH